MKKTNLFLLISAFICLGLQGCSNKEKDRTQSGKTSQIESSENPSNPEIKTTYGELPGGYKTMDEYYIKAKGDKVWHGRRLTQYPSGAKKMEAFYEHGKEKGYVKYDEAGNVIVDTRK